MLGLPTGPLWLQSSLTKSCHSGGKLKPRRPSWRGKDPRRQGQADEKGERGPAAEDPAQVLLQVHVHSHGRARGGAARDSLNMSMWGLQL